MENKDMIDDKLILENTGDFQNEIIIENEMLKELTNGKEMIKNEESGDGDISSFGALCTALSATIGTGNIVGVATAIAVGGPGA